MLHLDTAACGRASATTREAVAGHARLEAELGGYVAEQHAAPVVAGLRQDLALLTGLEPDDVALVESGTAALDALLAGWPFEEHGTVALVPSEWGPNVESFLRHGLRPVELPVDPDGVLDLGLLGRFLSRERPDLVHLDQAASHRGLVQPVRVAAEICREHDVPLWVDAAQSLGQVHAPPAADAVYGTSRKWLRGPRGVGFLGVAARHAERLDVLHRAKWAADLPTVRCLESGEAHVAGRVGLAHAVRALVDAGPARVAADLDRTGRATREALAGVPGWEVLGRVHQGAVTAVRPTRGQDVATVGARLLTEHAVLTTGCLPWRAPGELREPVLRLSPHRDCSTADLEQVAAALGRLGRRDA